MFKTIYFCPSIGSDNDNELISIQAVIDILAKSKIEVTASPSWSDLMVKLQSLEDQQLLIVFRLDFLERKHMMLDEVLSMLSSLTKFVAETKTIKIAVVVPKKCDSYLISKLKRNNILGIIPGLRFFEQQYSIEAYKTLQQGQSHWPSVAIKQERIVPKNEIDLTARQYQIFNLVAKRGLSNKKIAELLSISEDTVKSHVGTILKLYGVRNRTQLALANETGTIKSH